MFRRIREGARTGESLPQYLRSHATLSYRTTLCPVTPPLLLDNPAFHVALATTGGGDSDVESTC
jgi:hypothetical protein